MKKFIIIVVLIFAIATVHAQENFKVTKDIPHTSVKSQQKAGTCWAFATTSFIEAELIRKGIGELDLSELFFVYYAYVMKMNNFIRLKGLANFSQGGQAHDVFAVLAKYGAVTENSFHGLAPGDSVYEHTEMEGVLKAMGKFWTTQSKPIKHWLRATQAILDTYMGIAPREIEFKKKTYTPMEFGQAIVSLKTSDYVELTSFSHHPYYESFRLEIPDNWLGAQYYNLPIDELMEVINYAMENGYTVCWDGDVSEQQFKHRSNYARLEDEDLKLTQSLRQKEFDDFATTDDHLMHIVGLSEDSTGNRYYIIKNSWGPESNSNGGYLNMSKAFVYMKTVAILIHKDAIPEKIWKKLGI